MAIIFVPGQVALGDPNPGGPTATSNDKDVHIKVVKLTSANFTTSSGTNTLVAVLPADSTILEISAWKKTQLSGNSISAAALSVGTTSGGTELVSAYDIYSVTAGNQTHLNPQTNIMQNYNVPLGADVNIYVKGVATTGNPTAGEIYLKLLYVR